MAFAQQNYPQHLGNSKTVTIAEEGCLLTAICNGLRKMNGSGPDPATLNQFFVSHGIYTYDTVDKAADDLTWTSISKFDPTITLSQQVNDHNVTNANSIVKFRYQSVSHPWLGANYTRPNIINHFCWVDHIDNGQIVIIDSWDGQMKGPAAYVHYGTPIAYGSYIKHSPTPAPVATPPPTPHTPPAAPLPITYADQGTPYTVVVELKGYTTATAAGNQTGSYASISPGDYFIYRYYSADNHNLINISQTKSEQGWWVNGSLNKKPAPAPVSEWPAPEATPAPVEPTPVADSTPNPNDWRTTYVSFKDATGAEVPKLYVVNYEETPLLDGNSGQSGHLTKPDGSSAQYAEIKVAGTVTKDNIKYYRRSSGMPVSYGLIPMFDAYGRAYLSLYTDVYDPHKTLSEKVAVGNKDIQTFITKGIYTLDKIIDGVFKLKKKG